MLKLSDQNRGVTNNHDLALGACSGKYISWMAGDDLMLPGKISAQVAHMEASPRCNVCYHDVELFDGVSGKTIRLWSEADKPRNGDFLTLVKYGHFNTGISSMVRRSVSPEKFEPTITIASDWIYYVQCLANGGTIECIPGIYARQRRHPGNVTRSVDRAQPRHLLEQHLQSCAIILARWPRAAPAVRHRMAALMKMQRSEGSGGQYGVFLNSSLALRWSTRVFAAVIANRLFGVRR